MIILMLEYRHSEEESFVCSVASSMQYTSLIDSPKDSNLFVLAWEVSLLAQ